MLVMLAKLTWETAKCVRDGHCQSMNSTYQLLFFQAVPPCHRESTPERTRANREPKLKREGPPLSVSVTSAIPRPTAGLE
uniref:Uncharacterized protein n=1 Tax=Anguilla anguilla TaxID=7936 RepID=A0A0E9STY0_ANGAN